MISLIIVKMKISMFSKFFCLFVSKSLGLIKKRLMLSPKLFLASFICRTFSYILLYKSRLSFKKPSYPYLKKTAPNSSTCLCL